MSKTLTKRRARLNNGLKLRVAEEIEHYIARNPGKQIPNTAIADKFGINAHQVHTATDYLLHNDRLEQLSFKTYRTPMYENDVTPAMVVEKLEPKPEVAKTGRFDTIIDLAKTFKWETDSDSLKEFVKWVDNGASK